MNGKNAEKGGLMGREEGDAPEVRLEKISLTVKEVVEICSEIRMTIGNWGLNRSASMAAGSKICGLLPPKGQHVHASRHSMIPGVGLILPLGKPEKAYNHACIPILLSECASSLLVCHS